MAENYRRPYLDTCVWVSFLAGPDGDSEPPERFPVTKQIFDDADRSSIRLIESTFLVAELVKVDGQIGPGDIALFDTALSSPAIDWIELDIYLAREARRIARDFGVKPPDAIHLASALAAGADAFFTWDEKLLPKITDIGIEVGLPHWEGPLKLDDLIQTE